MSEALWSLQGWPGGPGWARRGHCPGHHGPCFLLCPIRFYHTSSLNVVWGPLFEHISIFNDIYSHHTHTCIYLWLTIFVFQINGVNSLSETWPVTFYPHTPHSSSASKALLGHSCCGFYKLPLHLGGLFTCSDQRACFLLHIVRMNLKRCMLRGDAFVLNYIFPKPGFKWELPIMFSTPQFRLTQSSLHLCHQIGSYSPHLII